MIARVSFIAAVVLASALPARADSGSPMRARYAAAIVRLAPRSAQVRADELADRVLLISAYYGLDARLLLALVTCESGWDVRAVSSSGAIGLGQLMPGTASSLRVDANSPIENLDGAARFLRRMIATFAPHLDWALAAYNAGPGAVERYAGVPPYAETRAYVARVLGLYTALGTRLDAPSADASALGPATMGPVDAASPAALRSVQSAPSIMDGVIDHARH